MIYFLTLIDDSDARDYFAEIYEKYHAMMFDCALKMMKNQQDAEDVLQQVLLNLWKYMDNVRKVSSEKLSSYLYMTTKNHCLTLMKRTKNEIQMNYDDYSEFQPLVEKNPEIIVIENYDKGILMDAFNELNPRYRQIILDKSILHLNDEQAASHIGIKETYVRECLSRARTALRKNYLKKLDKTESHK